ncbi:hypothetical protein LPMP_261210 [Leishmania panamensis]|uniref:DNA replication initiation factor, putative n=1 Tax=Leishmania panamensis TaxID=5679 RepID=A0A088RVG3_LEIPA|nr:hypothetical protein LPMP_261210 [Leishmania panamensis]AIN99234.1 hypothetical protein LPMP_261210 [Leishmania panamensis]
MTDHTQPLPSLTKAFAAMRPNLVTHKNHQLDRTELQRRTNNAEEDAQTTRESLVHERSHDTAHTGDISLSSFSSAEAAAGPTCLISFTGFRDEDVWGGNDAEGNDAGHDPLAHAAGGDAAPYANALSVCHKMASALPRVRVESKLTSSTNVLVARRGFTKKRLLAARQGIPVVLPKWVVMGCPALPTGNGITTTTATASASSYDLYAVPWLHGYVFSTTGLSTSEKAAIGSVCAAHGAVVEASLTYKCDVLLASAECVRALHQVLHADGAGDAAKRSRNQHLHHAEVQRTDAGLKECSGTEMLTLGKGGSVPHAAWLTDKVRFALELDIPVVDYVKLFAMLRLNRLPPPTWTPGPAVLLPKSSWKTRGPCDDDMENKNRYADALNGSDFDEIVHVCRVGAPAGGSAEWARILSVFTNAGGSSTAGRGPQRDEGAADQGPENMGLSAPLNGIALREGSMQSSSSSFTDSASTVSDPDLWESLLSRALVPSFDEPPIRGVETYPEVSGMPDPTDAADHLTGTTHATTTASPSSQAAWDKPAVSTADVEDFANARTEEPSTLHVSLPDYYSAATGPELAPYSSSQWGYARQEVLTTTEDPSWGTTTVDPSPRLTTNALLHREAAPPRQLRHTSEPLACAQPDRAESVALRQRTAAYYEMRRSSDRLPAQLPARDAVAISREAAPLHAPAGSPGYSLVALSQTTMVGGAPLAATQVLVESCVSAGELELASMQQVDAHQTSAFRATAARQALPLFAMHPPYLTICVLGCTELELRKTARWSEQCRLLRSPVPTSTTDIVLLGSRILTKKRYTMSYAADSVNDESSAKGGEKQRQQRPTRHRNPLSARSGGKNRHRRDHAGGGVTVAIRYWEMDAAVARTLADVCGVPLSRMAPLKWLEDAASEAKKACEKAMLAEESVAAQRSASHALAVDSDESCTDTCWMTATTPPDKLVGLLEEHLAAAAAAAAESEERVALHQRQLFHPLPPLSPEQLPDMADPKYFIRVRQAAATLWASNAAPLVAQRSHNISAGASLAGLEVEKQAKRSERHHHAQQAAGGSATQPASDSATLLTRNEKSAADRAPVEGDDSLTAAASRSVDLVPAISMSTVQLGVRKATSLSTEDEQHSYEAALATAERRFNQLVALFRVSGDDGNIARVMNVGAAEDDRQGHSKALEACHFCCVEGEYARVDWAVVRGLIRYGGGRVEKRAADDWQTLLQQQQQQQPRVTATATNSDVQQDQQDQHFTRALRWSVEYTKLRQKLLRVMRDVELSHDVSDQTRAGTLPGCASAERENAAEIARLTAKLQRVSLLCQQAPVLCLCPHSFQRPAADERGMAATADATVRHMKGLPGRAAVGPASPCKRLHALHRLPAVTMDYVLACVAVGYCLSPHSCFLFDVSIPSAPDMRLFQRQHQRQGGGGAPSQKASARHTGSKLGLGLIGSNTPEGSNDEAGKRLQPGAVSAGNGCIGRGKAPLHRPALSSWVLERRYTKTDSVGVCISFLWRLPTPPASESERCWSRVDMASPPAKSAAVVPSLTPDASLVPLLRVLLLGLRNAAEALGGHVVDTFSPSAVTHVVSVDIGGILSGTLRDAFTCDVVEKTSAVTGSGGGDRPFPYWPVYSVESIARYAARDEVSLVGLEWLAACVEWGVFVDEAAYAPPPDLLALVQAEKQKALLASAQAARTKQHRRAAQVQKRQPPRQSLNHCHLTQHRAHVAAPPPADPALPGALVPPAARPVSHLEWHWKRTGTPPRGGSDTAAPHTPPPPRLVDYDSPPNRDDEEKEEHECCTPVIRGILSASTTWCDSSAGLCTPPVREAPLPDNVVRRCQQSPPLQPLSSPVPPPPPRPQTLPDPDSSSQCMNFRARSAGTPSIGDHAHHYQHRRRSSPSASQQNTRSLLEEKEAEAYVEHLGSLFNFFSPGSTPLPSSARRCGERSTARYADADASTPRRLRSPFLPHTLSQSHPPNVTSSPRAPHSRCELMHERGMPRTSSSLLHTQALTPSKTSAALQMTGAEKTSSAVGLSNALSTPRRRTLRGAAAVCISSATKKSTLSSPDRQHRRTENFAVAVSSSVTNLQVWTAVAGVGDAPCDVESDAPDANAPPPQPLVLPSLLGGSTELSRDGTVDAKPVGDSSTASICEEVDTKQRQRQDGGCTESMWVSQTPNALTPEGKKQRSNGAATGTAPQHRAHKRGRVTGGQRDGSRASASVSWMHDASLESPQQKPQDIAVVECVDVEPMSGEVLVDATFIAATPEAYGATPAATSEASVGERHCKAAATLVLAGDREEVEHEDETKGVPPGPDVVDAAHNPLILRPPSTTATASPLAQKAMRPRLASCSAPRPPSPSPYSPPPPPRRMAMDGDGGASIVANVAEEEHQCGTPCAYTDSNAPALSSWTRHRPLSISSRPSRSPPLVSSPLHMEPTALVTGTAVAVLPRTTVATSCRWDCLRIYALHDLPLRTARVRRCEEALETFMRHCGGVMPRSYIDIGLRTAEPPAKDSDQCGGVGVGSDSTRSSPTSQPTPPLFFVSRCEDADVLVTHQVNLRESVLVGVAGGCWVVRPGFLECVVAVLDGACWSGNRSTANSMRGQRHLTHPSAAAAASVFCALRLREALPTYEWTAEALPRVPALGCPPESNSVTPMQRALAQQCRRQRERRERAAGADVVNGDAEQTSTASRPSERIFEGNSFVLCCSFSANAVPAGGTSAERCRTSSRVRAIERVLETGGGCLCCSVQVGCAPAEIGVKTDEITGAVATATHVPPIVQPPLQCCVWAPSPPKQGNRRLQRDFAHTSSPLVMDAALYHDLLWLICNQVRQMPSETLFVLLDESLLGSNTDDAQGGTVVCVSPAPRTTVAGATAAAARLNGKDAGNEDLLTTPPLSEHHHASKKRRTENVEAHNSPQPTTASVPEAASVAAGALASSDTCTVAAWLSSWLLPSPDDGRCSKAMDGRPPCHRGYAPAAAHAMRAHLGACCAAVRGAADEIRGSTCTSGSYHLADVPFDVPSVEEVRQACTDGEGGTKAGSTMSASRGVVRRIEFRSTSWVGACVAAGGSAMMAAATEAWMVEWEAHTRWGVLSLE